MGKENARPNPSVMLLLAFGMLAVFLWILIPKPQPVSLGSSSSELTLDETQAFQSSSEASALAAQGVAISYSDFSAVNADAMSLRHGADDGTGVGTESRNVMKGLLGVAGWNRMLRQKGPNKPTQSGDIRIYGGETDGRMNIAILWVVNTYVAFAVVSAPVDASFSGGFNSAELAWTCAWFVSAKVANGHFLPSDPDTWFTVGQSWEWWAETQAAYNLYTPLFQVQLPPLP